MAAVQLTFTHKQYTEYKERNIHNNHKINCVLITTTNPRHGLQICKENRQNMRDMRRYALSWKIRNDAKLVTVAHRQYSVDKASGHLTGVYERATVKQRFKH